MSKFYLVTGGTGFIGSALVRHLILRGDRVRTLDDNSRGSTRRLADVLDDVEVVEGDIRDRDAVVGAAKGVDALVHLAYVNGTRYFYEAPDLVLDVAVRGILNVLDACRDNSIGELALASSSEVYQTPPRVPTDESVPLVVPDLHNPRYCYGGGKIISELLAVNYGRKHLERVVIFRPHNVYGPDMGTEHVIPELVLKAQAQMEGTKEGSLRLEIQGDGSQSRAFVFIDDFTDGAARVIDHGEHLGVYHVGTRTETTIREVVEAIGRYLGRPIEVVPGPLPAGGTQRRCPDITKLEGLGYLPRTTFDEGVARTAEWYLKHR